MPSFADTARSASPPEEVWKLLRDPSRFPEWWAGTGSVEEIHRSGDWRISCNVSDLRFEWRLEPNRDGTRIDVLVDIPEEESEQLQEQREVIRASLVRLAEVAVAAPL